MATKKTAPDYSESSIRVLKGLEPVKQRPGMYTRTENPLHIIQEVIDNASDEALGRPLQEHRRDVNGDGSITVEDDGRGIPVGIHPEEGVSTVEIVFTRLHAGGKFDKGSGGAYAFSGGLHGVGVSVTNALSKRLEITVWRKDDQGNGVHNLVFADGDVIEPLTSAPPSAAARRTAPASPPGRTASTSIRRTSRWPSCSACCARKPCCCRA
jgi:topoisomerase-4 subunit B